MTDKIIAEEICRRLKMFINQSNWLDCNVPDQARAMFTTICLMGEIDADTSLCDSMLLELYNNSDMESIDVSYDDFEKFMIGLII